MGEGGEEQWGGKKGKSAAVEGGKRWKIAGKDGKGVKPQNWIF